MGRGFASKTARMNQRWAKRKGNQPVGGHSLGGREKPTGACYVILHEGRIYHIDLDDNNNPSNIFVTPKGMGSQDACNGYEVVENSLVKDVQLRNIIVRKFYEKHR